ncbi:GbsR/MarR family transcriptional regulator [Nonomuraea diastatica]|uniref:MarR family transcriptional regulator n=1 Tax=Nonomuraea diastatica TaxID=1848329 RepID=A0A4R4WSK0_9ACTN|nr:MarR family transcriptional regulator [Nonomuraea diastatica]TDD20546.1 MarR family transcriptional regulator [Nonomuraea diastatica]
MATAKERDFVERYALFFASTTGVSRTAGRLHGWLQVCDPPHQSLTQLADVVELSKASVSPMIRQLEQLQFVERAPIPGTREHYYQLKGSGDASRMIEDRGKFFAWGRQLAELGLEAVGEDPARRERLEEFLDLYTFMEEEFGARLISEWEKYRQDRRAARHRDG